MESFKKLFFQRVKELVTPHGFKRNGDGFCRVINDVCQSFSLDVLYLTKDLAEFLLTFGIVPICSGYTGGGEIYELTQGRLFGENIPTKYMHYNRQSEESINACINDLIEDISLRLIPFFEKATNSKLALDELWTIEKAICDNSPNIYKGASISMAYDDSKYYMALKHSRYDYILESYKMQIKRIEDMAAERNYSLENRLYYLKDEQKAEIEREEAEQIAYYQNLIDTIGDLDSEKIKRELEENEAFSREALKDYIVE